MSVTESRIFAGIIPSYVLSNRKLTQSAKLLFGVLAGFAASNKDCFANNSALAEAIGIKPRHIRNCLRELITEGYCQLGESKGVRIIKVITTSTVTINTYESKGGNTVPGGAAIQCHPSYETGRQYNATISTTTLKSTLSLRERDYPKNENSISENAIATVKDCPNIIITEKEKTALIARYKKEGLSMQDLKDGCVEFNGWLLDSQKRATKLKSHYRCLIGWVLKEMLTRAKIRAEKQSADIRLERSKQVAKMPLPGENPQDSYARKINAHRASQNGINRKTTGAENVGVTLSKIMANRKS